MAMNLDAVLRITAQVAGQEDITSLEKSIGSLARGADGARDAFTAVGKSAAWQGAAVGAAAISAGLVVATRAAIDFESSVAEVRKVMDGIDTPQALGEIRTEILQLSREMPITAAGFADIYAAAGQAGIARDEVRGFAVDVAQMAVAFDMTAEQAGSAMAKLRSSLNLTQPEVGLLTDALNHLSNNTASSAAELVDFTLRTGTTGKAVGLAGEQTAAFGAAMIGAGVNTDTAATSFNNMIKALSRGGSMTARQVSALERLGLATDGAADSEGRYTQAVEEESRRRLEVARDETNQLSKEITRRYRDAMRQQQDAWDDESRAYARALDDRTDVQIDALNNERERAIKAAESRAEATGRSAAGEIDAINRIYDQRIKTARRAADDELRLVERQARDRQQAVVDAMDDQQEAELDAAQRKYQELEREEKSYAADMVKRFKESGGDAGKQAGEALARNLQAAPLETIQDIFRRIRGLSKDQQLAVISDLFGDEARGLVPLITNTELLGNALALVGDQSDYAGSRAAEYAARSETTANKLQLAMNNAQAFAIVIGTEVLPALTKAAVALTPLLTKAGELAQKFPGLTQAAVVLAGAFVALVGSLPFIASAVFVLGQLGVTLAGVGTAAAGLASVFATIPAALGGVIGPALAAVGTAILGLLKGVAIALGAFFSGPAGIIALVVAGVALIIAAIWTFREPIGKFFTWLGTVISGWVQGLWQWGEPIRTFWVSVWNGARDAVIGFINNATTTISGWVQGLWQWGEPIRTFWVELWEGLKQNVTDYFAWLGEAITAGFELGFAVIYTIFVAPWVALWEFVLREPITAFIDWLNDLWAGIAKAFIDAWDALRSWWANFWGNTITKPVNKFKDFILGMPKQIVSAFQRLGVILLTPWRVLWDTTLRAPVTSMVNWLGSVWNAIKTSFDRAVKDPIIAAWTAVTTFIPNAMEKVKSYLVGVWNGIIAAIKNAINSLLAGIGNAINYYINGINNLIRRINSLPSALGVPGVSEIPNLPIPQLAAGAVVDRPTLALIGEGGEREYVIPESAMAAASAAYIEGARGDDVLAARAAMDAMERDKRNAARYAMELNKKKRNEALQSAYDFGQTTLDTPSPRSISAASYGLADAVAPSPAPSNPNPRIFIELKTGPVLEFDGKKYVTVPQMRRALRETAQSVVATMRTPSARIATAGRSR